MYNIIEEEYKSKYPKLGYTHVLAIEVFIIWLIYILSRDFMLTIIIELILVPSTCYFYVLKSNGYLKSPKKYTKFRENIRKYKDNKNEVKKDNLINILRNNDIVKKNQIKELHEHYLSYVPKSIKKGIFEGIFEVSVTIVAIFMVYVNLDKGKANFDKLPEVAATFLTLLIVLIVIICSYRAITDSISFMTKKNDVSEELEKYLGEFCIFFDSKYKYILNKK